MTHPSSLVLESYACGEPLRPEVLEHVEGCAACGAFVEELRALVAGGPSVKEAEAAVSRTIARTQTHEREPANVAHREHRTRPTDSKRRIWMIATSVVTPLAAAAAILLLLRAPPAPAPAPSPPPDKIQMGVLPPHAEPAEPDTRFKGGMQVAVVRERAGQQTRFSSTVTVKPGDCLRVEVALDREQAILGAVLSDDGSYLELMPEGVRGAGTYFSERSAKIDGSPTRGTIIVGSPEAVARARGVGGTKQLDGVTTLRVEWEAP